MIEIRYSQTFLKEAKKLAKKFKKLKEDLQVAIKEIEEQNDFGVFLGSNLYKKRIKNSSIPTGKRGGFRVILFLKTDTEIILLTIYSKTDIETLSDDDLRELVKLYFANNPSPL